MGSIRINAVRQFASRGSVATLAVGALVLSLVGPLSARAATPPATVNYQGVLRDQNDKPLSGTYDMVLRFMGAATAGDEILVDQHAAATANAVTVTGGLFNVVLGSGTITDGSGPGTYTSLDAVFRDYGSVWLEVMVGAETLSPRTQIQSAPYALNTTQLAGHPDSYFINTSSTPQQKNGELDLNTVTSSTALYAHNGGNGYGLIASANGYAVWAYGDQGGIRGESTTGSGGVFSGPITGVTATGASAGVIATGDVGGRFFDGTQSVRADIATVTKGINVVGGDYAGYFQTPNANSTGVYASASSRGGYFTDAAGDNATLAGGGMGISASSASNIGAYFSNGSPYFSYTQIPWYDLGIYAYGANYGGQFNAFSTSNFAQVAYSTYKILGTGTVSFVQNHPEDPSKVIVYVAPEGDEAAVYTRGSGRLTNGEARVRLGETFALVANPDIGLTATATPRGEPIPLAVSELSPGEVVVRGPAGSNAEFDYMVWGLRIGFEEQSIVQPKQKESKIPSMHMHEQFFNDEPALRRYTALARFEGVEESVHGKKNVDHSRADRLRDAVGVAAYRDPQGLAHDPGRPAVDAMAPPAPATGAAKGSDAAVTSSSIPVGAPQRETGPGAADEPAGPQPVGNDAIGTTRAVAADLDLFMVEGTIEAGDVVSLAPATPGSVARSAGPNDSLVIGCAQQGEADPALAPPAGHPILGAGRIGIATSHMALCRVDASYGAIAVGDHLSPSPAPGIAMKQDPGAAGTTFLGRAIDPLPSGVGLIRVLLGAR